MKFRTSVSFNAQDCRMVRQGGRMVIEIGVLKRCKDIVRLMRDRNLRGISDIRDSLSESYRYQDLYHAARKLKDARILVHNGYGRWAMTIRGHLIWNEIAPVQYRLRARQAA